MDSAELRNETLTRHLGRVVAPDGLWQRVVEPRTEPRPGRHLAWATATAIIILVTMWGLRGTASVPAAGRNPQLACAVCHA